MSEPQRLPVWPIPIPVVCLCSEVGSGKTLFGLTITDPREVLVWDEEGSSATYQPSLGFTRLSITHEVQKRHPKGFGPLHVFEWWRDHLLSIPKGKYRVAMLDTIALVDAGLTDWVEAHPEKFNHTKGQYDSMSALKWGDVDELWKTLISECEARFETTVFTAHVKPVWGSDKKPIAGKTRPGWKKAFDQRASLILQLERKPDAKGVRPDKPSAIVLKDRLCHLVFDAAAGEVKAQGILPPRLAVATPHMIRAYIAKPANFDKLKADERIPEEVMSEDERLLIKARIADSEVERQRLEIERLAKAESLRQPRPTASVATQATPPAADPSPEPSPKASPAPVAAKPQASKPSTSSDDDPPVEGGGGVLSSQIEELKTLRPHLYAASPGLTDDQKTAMWREKLKPYGVASAKELTREQAGELVESLRPLIPF